MGVQYRRAVIAGSRRVSLRYKLSPVQARKEGEGGWPSAGGRFSTLLEMKHLGRETTCTMNSAEGARELTDCGSERAGLWC